MAESLTFGINADVGQAMETLKALTNTVNALASHLKTMDAQLNKSSQTTQSVGDAGKKATPSLGEVAKAFIGIKDSAMNIITAGDTLRGHLNSISGTIHKLGMDALAAAERVVQLTNTLTVIYKSPVRAAGMLDWVNDFASKTPFLKSEIASMTTLMAAYDIDVQKYMTAIGDQASAMGKSIEEVTHAFLGMQHGMMRQMRTLGIDREALVKKGRELFNQEIVDTNEHIVSMRMALEAYKAISKEKFGGQMGVMMSTMTGQMSNLKDSWGRLLSDMGTRLQPLAQIFIAVGGWIVGALQKIPDPIKNIIMNMGILVVGISSAMAAFVTIGTAITAFATIFGAAAVAMMGFIVANAAFLGIAVGIAVALGTAIALVQSWENAMVKQQKETEKAAYYLSQYSKAKKGAFAGTDSDSIKDLTEKIQKQKDALIGLLGLMKETREDKNLSPEQKETRMLKFQTDRREILRDQADNEKRLKGLQDIELEIGKLDRQIKMLDNDYQKIEGMSWDKMAVLPELMAKQAEKVAAAQEKLDKFSALPLSMRDENKIIEAQKELTAEKTKAFSLEKEQQANQISLLEKDYEKRKALGETIENDEIRHYQNILDKFKLTEQQRLEYLNKIAAVEGKIREESNAKYLEIMEKNISIIGSKYEAESRLAQSSVDAQVSIIGNGLNEQRRKLDAAMLSEKDDMKMRKQMYSNYFDSISRIPTNSEGGRLKVVSAETSAIESSIIAEKNASEQRQKLIADLTEESKTASKKRKEQIDDEISDLAKREENGAVIIADLYDRLGKAKIKSIEQEKKARKEAFEIEIQANQLSFASQSYNLDLISNKRRSGYEESKALLMQRNSLEIDSVKQEIALLNQLIALAEREADDEREVISLKMQRISAMQKIMTAQDKQTDLALKNILDQTIRFNMMMGNAADATAMQQIAAINRVLESETMSLEKRMALNQQKFDLEKNLYTARMEAELDFAKKVMELYGNKQAAENLDFELRMKHLQEIGFAEEKITLLRQMHAGQQIIKGYEMTYDYAKSTGLISQDALDMHRQFLEAKLRLQTQGTDEWWNTRKAILEVNKELASMVAKTLEEGSELKKLREQWENASKKMPFGTIKMMDMGDLKPTGKQGWDLEAEAKKKDQSAKYQDNIQLLVQAGATDFLKSLKDVKDIGERQRLADKEVENRKLNTTIDLIPPQNKAIEVLIKFSNDFQDNMKLILDNYRAKMDEATKAVDDFTTAIKEATGAVGNKEKKGEGKGSGGGGATTKETIGREGTINLNPQQPEAKDLTHTPAPAEASTFDSGYRANYYKGILATHGSGAPEYVRSSQTTNNRFEKIEVNVNGPELNATDIVNAFQEAYSPYM